VRPPLLHLLRSLSWMWDTEARGSATMCLRLPKDPELREEAERALHLLVPGPSLGGAFGRKGTTSRLKGFVPGRIPDSIRPGSSSARRPSRCSVSWWSARHCLHRGGWSRRIAGLDRTPRRRPRLVRGFWRAFPGRCPRPDLVADFQRFDQLVLWVMALEDLGKILDRPDEGADFRPGLMAGSTAPGQVCMLQTVVTGQSEAISPSRSRWNRYGSCPCPGLAPGCNNCDSCRCPGRSRDTSPSRARPDSSGG